MDENIKKILKKWINHEKEINDFEKQIQELKNKQSQINPYLEKYMEKNNLEKIYINKNCSMYNKQCNDYKQIDEKFLNHALSKIINEQEKKEKIVKYILDNRIINTENKLVIEE